MTTYKIYIDGSHLDKQNNGRLGIGGIIIDPSMPGTLGIRGKFSRELTPEYMRTEFGAIKCSNPSAELTAVLFAIREFKSLLSGKSEAIIFADYIGVREWMTGKWKIKEPYIKKIKEAIDKEIKSQGLTGRLSFEWVRGHQKGNNPDVIWNNYADILAKGQEEDDDE